MIISGKAGKGGGSLSDVPELKKYFETCSVVSESFSQRYIKIYRKNFAIKETYLLFLTIEISLMSF